MHLRCLVFFGTPLGAHALRLYLYLAANKNGFDLALSQAAATNAIGIPRSTYHDQLRILMSKGYIVPVQGNIYAFYEKPQPRTGIDKNNTTPELGLDFENMSADSRTNSSENTENPPENIEINNKCVSIDNSGINSGDEINKNPVAEKNLKAQTQAEEMDELERLFDLRMKEFKF